MFSDEKVLKYKQIFKKNGIEFTNEEELKLVLNQMYVYSSITYEQFKINSNIDN